MSSSLVEAPRPRNGLNRIGAVTGWVCVWAALFAVTLLVYSKRLKLGLMYDDVAMLLYFRRPDFTGWDAFRPLDNGFLRPIFVFGLWAIWKIFEVRTWPYLIYAAALHAMVAVVAGMVFRSITRVSLLAALIMSLSVAVASSAFVTVFYSSNTGDSLLALWTVAVVGCYHQWLHWRKSWGLWMTFVFLFLALGSKEPAVVICGVLILQTWISGSRRRLDWVVCFVATLVCSAFAGLVFYLQRSAAISYTNEGYASMAPMELSQRLLGYLGSTLVPSSYVMPITSAERTVYGFLHGVVYVSAFGGIVFSLIQLLREKADALVRSGAVLFISAVVMLMPILTVSLEPGPHSPLGRYVYTPSVLVIMALGFWALRLYQHRRGLWWGAAVVWGIWLIAQPVVIRKSSCAAPYYKSAGEWKALVGEIGRISPEWPAMQRIAIYSGAGFGSHEINEPYVNALLRVYYPRLLIDFVANRTTPETTFVYVFDGRRLTEITP